MKNLLVTMILYPLDLNDPISNLVGDSLSGFDVWGPFPTV